VNILIKAWQAAQIDAFPVRKAVFIEEQGVPEALEIDEFDSRAIHALAYRDQQCVGTARLLVIDRHQAQIGRMAVLSLFRHQGIGGKILARLISLAKSQGIFTLVLHAQLTAIPFYEKHGFVAQGPDYDEAGIPHRNMMLISPK
jgi:predicted GNAT family N-acyltransferase